MVEIRTALELFFLSTNYTNLHELRASYRWLYSSTDEHGFSRMGLTSLARGKESGCASYWDAYSCGDNAHGFGAVFLSPDYTDAHK